MSANARVVAVKTRIAAACESVGRDPFDVTLIVASKTQSIAAIQQLYDLGLRHFGESRLQEALPKIKTLPEDIVWHFVGKLQSNKAKKAAQIFDCIHTFENATQLREVGKAERDLDGLIEVNIANEPQKSGIAVENLDETVQAVLNSQHVRFRGLMTIGPNLDRPEEMRPYFRALRELNERFGGEWLSMGMSDDFDVAIQEGATHIRVGTALFGERQ